MSKKVVIGIIIVIVLALVLYWVWYMNNKIEEKVIPPPTGLQNQQAPTGISAEPQTTPEQDLQVLDNLDEEYDSGFNQEMQSIDAEINKL
jgi:hypothetical protein